MDSTPTLPSAGDVAPAPAPAAVNAGWLALDRQLCFALYSASLSMTKLSKPLLDPLGLEAQGLLQRQRDAADERRVLLSLTQTGQALREQAEAVPRSVACATACELDEIAQLTRQLQDLRRRLQGAQGGTAAPSD